MVITFCLHLYEKYTPKKSTIFLIWVVNFQNCEAIKTEKYICFHTKVKKKVFFLNLIKDVPVYIRPWFKAKKGGTLALPPSTFQSGEGNCPQLLFPWSDISEVRTADSYGASEFMSVQSFSGVLVAQSSVFCVTVFVIFCHCQPLNICLCFLIPVYLYHLLLMK